MKKIFMLMFLACNGVAFAQKTINETRDTIPTVNEKTEKNVIENVLKNADTIRVGGMVIVKNAPAEKNSISISLNKTPRKLKNVTTNWWMIDIGFSGVNDLTDYASSAAKAFMPNAGSTPINAGDFSLRSSRVSNFNLWIFLRKHNIASHVLNLKYGVGIEGNNYFYKTPLTYVDGSNPYVKRDNISFTKNKLVASYLTVPLILNINTAPYSAKKGLELSAGISGGILYRSRQKQESQERGKTKQKTDFNLERFKLALVGELGVGPLKFYGSYALTPLHKYGVEQMPYNVGIRLGNL